MSVNGMDMALHAVSVAMNQARVVVATQQLGNRFQINVHDLGAFMFFFTLAMRAQLADKVFFGQRPGSSTVIDR